ncbi:hypothetical protein SCYZ1_26 [Pseudomonas phage SCYZ1]|nr:hypothetical protein SCYZ1_26 [Pseudomonas phage SCYZ1]
MLLTAKEWSARGFRIKTGTYSRYRGAGGAALFSRFQVTPWEYVPAFKQSTPQYVTVDGQLYRKV